MAGQNITIDSEIWKPIPDFPEYEISNYGRVRSYWHKPMKGSGGRPIIIGTPTIITPVITSTNRSKQGYFFIPLRKDGKRCNCYIHRLVLLSFIGPAPKGYVCCHNDNNSLNNKLENLRWDTPKNNALDRHKNDVYNSGQHNGMSKLKDFQVINIKHNLINHFSIQDIAKIYNVSVSAIRGIISGRRWKYIK